LDDLPKLFSFSIDIVFEVLCRLLQLQTAFHSEALELLYSCLGVNYHSADDFAIDIDLFRDFHKQLVDDNIGD